MSSVNVLAPAWLGKSYDFANRFCIFGNYVDNDSGAGGALEGRLNDRSSERGRLSRLWSAVRPSGEHEQAAAERDFHLALTMLLDHARNCLTGAEHRTRNQRLKLPTSPLGPRDLERAQQTLMRCAPSVRTLDVSARLDPAAWVGTYLHNDTTEHLGQAALLGAVFACLGPAATLDLGYNFFAPQELTLLNFRALEGLQALNLSYNRLASSDIRHLRRSGIVTLRHLSLRGNARGALSLDQDGVWELNYFLRGNTGLKSLELHLQVGEAVAPHRPMVPSKFAARSASLNLLPLFCLQLRALQTLYIGLPTVVPHALATLDLKNFPALTRLGLAFPAREHAQAFAEWAPEPPASLQQVWLNKEPSSQLKGILRRKLNRTDATPALFADSSEAQWHGYFDRVGGPDKHAYNNGWSLRRAPLVPHSFAKYLP